MPPTAGRPHPVDLWLCGHHYRIGRGAVRGRGKRGAARPDSPQIDHVAAPGVGRLHFRGRRTAEGSTSPGVGPKAPLPARPALTRWKEADKQVN